MDDLATAVLYTLENNVDENILNVGTGSDLSIKELAELVQKLLVTKVRLNGTNQSLMVHQKS